MAHQYRVHVRIKRINKDFDIPLHHSEGAAGYDLHASIPSREPIELYPGGTIKIPTGVAIELPDHGYVGLLCPRSGMSKHGITIVNTPGIIDSDYRGELTVVLARHDLSRVPEGQPGYLKEVPAPYTISRGDRIAQLIIVPVTHANFEEVEELSTSERGARGYGSSGV